MLVMQRFTSLAIAASHVECLRPTQPHFVVTDVPEPYMMSKVTRMFVSGYVFEWSMAQSISATLIPYT